jgi:hypothetical protein
MMPEGVTPGERPQIEGEDAGDSGGHGW